MGGESVELRVWGMGVDYGGDEVGKLRVGMKELGVMVL